MAILFDTLKLAQRLMDAGVPREQAQGTAAALAETMTGDVATRQDLDLVRQDIDHLRQDFGNLRECVDLRLGENEARLHAEIEKVRTEVEKVRADVRGWLIAQLSAIAVLIGLAAGLSHLFH